ncbi:MAG: efflux transporter outer membrane subunit [Chlamydiota bacterium]
MRKFTAIKILFGLGLAGCMMGPRYETPEMPFASSFTENVQTPGPEVDLREWWTQFDDPILNQMIDEAIGNNYDLRIAAERIAQVRARYQFASANLWPEIDLTGSAIRFRNSQALFDSPFMGPSVQNLFQIGFDASWELDFFGRLRSLKEAAFDDLQASRENFRDVYITLLSEVTRNYALFRALQQRIALTGKQIRVDEARLELSIVRNHAGLKSAIEPLQTESELDARKATLPPLEAQMRASLYRIAVLLGRTPEEIPENWEAFQPIPQSQGKIPVGLPSDLLRRRPDIRQAERRLAAATAHIGAAIAELFPSFSLTGSFGYQSDQASNWITGNAKTWSFGPAVFWPAIDFGRIRANIDLQNALQREALLSYELTILQALEEVEEALVLYSKETLRLQNLKNQVSALKESRDLTEALFKAGLSSLSTLFDAEEQVLLAELEEILSEQTLSEDLISIYKSLGGEWSCSSTP